MEKNLIQISLARLHHLLMKLTHCFLLFYEACVWKFISGCFNSVSKIRGRCAFLFSLCISKKVWRTVWISWISHNTNFSNFKKILCFQITSDTAKLQVKTTHLYFCHSKEVFPGTVQPQTLVLSHLIRIL